MADAASSVVRYFDGKLAFCDPVAIDQACIDLIYNSTDSGKEYLIERIESRNGIHTINFPKNLDLEVEVMSLLILIDIFNQYFLFVSDFL